MELRALEAEGKLDSLREEQKQGDSNAHERDGRIATLRTENQKQAEELDILRPIVMAQKVAVIKRMIHTHMMRRRLRRAVGLYQSLKIGVVQSLRDLSSVTREFATTERTYVEV